MNQLRVWAYVRLIGNRRICLLKGHMVGDESRMSGQGVVIQSQAEIDTEFLGARYEIIFWGFSEGNRCFTSKLQSI